MKKSILRLCLLFALSSCHQKDSKTIGIIGDKPQESSSTAVTSKNDFKKPVYNKEVTHSPSDLVLLDDSVSLSGSASSVVSGAVNTFASTSDNAVASADETHYWTPSATASAYTVNLASMGSTPVPSPTNTVNRTVENKIPSQIIKNATIDFTVSSADSSHTRIQQLIAEYDAYLNLDKRMQNPESIILKMQIRVSPENFDKLIDAIMKQSIYTETKDISADDVTAQFVDMEVRLKSKRDVEKRYADLLSRAQKVNDILVIESNRRQIQEEIESMEGNLRLMRDQVAYSTVYLTVTQKIKEAVKAPEPEKQMTFLEQLREALATGWLGIRFLVVFILTIWPLLLISGIVAIIVRLKTKSKINDNAEEIKDDSEDV